MSLGDDIAFALPELQAQAESRMTEKITAGEFRDETDDDGNAVRVVVTTRYTGEAQVKYPSMVVGDAGSGSLQIIGTQSVIVKLPVGAPLLYQGDEIQVDASTDPALVGRQYAVEGHPQSGQVTSRRYPVKELS